ncbi:hypothetical protein [Microbacterium sp. KR10-403]|uniref:hypothetical protein n=1 Tax=Microbacterium sp. KR10-403 TaxID=3158581 RepID=UPI0032E3FE5B
MKNNNKKKGLALALSGCVVTVGLLVGGATLANLATVIHDPNTHSMYSQTFEFTWLTSGETLSYNLTPGNGGENEFSIENTGELPAQWALVPRVENPALLQDHPVLTDALVELTVGKKGESAAFKWKGTFGDFLNHAFVPFNGQSSIVDAGKELVTELSIATPVGVDGEKWEEAIKNTVSADFHVDYIFSHSTGPGDDSPLDVFAQANGEQIINDETYWPEGWMNSDGYILPATGLLEAAGF